MKVWLTALVALTVVRLWLAAVVPLVPDEAYYFLWSRDLQAGYLDHPPMVAWWIRVGTWLAGPGALGVRLLGPVSAALGTLLIYDAGENFFPGRGVGLRAALLLNATLLVGVGAVVMAPDAPLVFFWGLALAGLGRLLRSGNDRWWLVIGLAAGLALLSKYTGFLMLASVGGWLLSSVAGRARLRGVWPWVGLVLALVVFAPPVVWNAGHHWASFLKQGGREAGLNAGRSVQFLVEFAVSLFFLATPVVFVLAVQGLRRLGASPAARLLLWLTILPLVVFLEHTLSDRIQANWIAIILPSACLAAAYAPSIGRWLRTALVSGLALTALVYVQALTSLIPIPARGDPTALQLAGWRDFAQQAGAGHPGFITSDDYATAAILAYYAPAGVPVLGFDTVKTHRWVYFALPAVTQGAGLLFTRRNDTKCPKVVGTLNRSRGAESITTYRVCAVTIGEFPGYVLPRP
jgi:4-amino-4-deoxy-L-arabinose transferase-like glycosyltransferase